MYKALYVLLLFCVVIATGANVAIAQTERDSREQDRRFVPNKRFVRYYCFDDQERRLVQLDAPKKQVVEFIVYSGEPKREIDHSARAPHWYTFPKLKEIRLDTATITPELMAYIANIKSVTHVEMENCLIGSSDALLPLRDMKWLKSLYLSNFSFGAATPTPKWDFLEGLTSLETFDASGSYDLGSQALRKLSSLKHLDYVSIDVAEDIDGALLARLVNMPSLEHLDIITQFEAQGVFLKAPGPDSKLRYLRIRPQSLSWEEFRHLLTTKLEHLEIGGLAFESTKDLPDNTSLKLLHIHFQDGVRASPNNLAFLERLVGLEELVCSTSVNRFSSDLLKTNINLKTVVIPGAKLNEHDIVNLSRLPRLRHLVVANAKTSKWYYTARQRLPEVKIRCRSTDTDR